MSSESQGTPQSGGQAGTPTPTSTGIIGQAGGRATGTVHRSGDNQPAKPPVTTNVTKVIRNR